MLKSERAEKARQTLEYFEKGYYMLDQTTVNCQSCFTTEFISESRLDTLTLPNGNFTPQYETVNESIVDVIFNTGNCGVLNFASAKNPGGGFLNGAVAQEECLAISSGFIQFAVRSSTVLRYKQKMRDSIIYAQYDLFTRHNFYTGQFVEYREIACDCQCTNFASSQRRSLLQE